ncbi:hypothetical protein C8R44DRAFT_733191 [Mycena epipterygia]|nr:hypothetical protein C8R44DRAFT_733191 [Mycena epipterygia]
MARTKQNARKATGGPAPEKSLAPANQRVNPAAPPAPPSKKRKREPDGDNSRAIAIPAPSAAPPANTVQSCNSFCMGCEDSGDLVQCELCDRWICRLCIELPATGEMHMYTFYCPRCWHDGHPLIPAWTEAGAKHMAGRDQPYQGIWLDQKPQGVTTYTGVQTQRALWPALKPGRLAIVSIRLEAMALLGDPVTTVLSHLAPYYLHDPFLFETHSYNLDARIEEHDDAVEALAARLAGYAPDKVVIFLTTHSVPGTGLIHTATGGTAAADPAAVLRRLMPEALQDVIRDAATSLLVLQACGALNSDPAFHAVKDFVAEAGFQYALGFTAAHFMPAAANGFLQETIHSFVVTGHAKKFRHILASNYELGIHSDVLMYFPKRKVYRYVWTHPLLRPYGHAVTPQCPRCRRLSAYVIKTHTEDKIQLACRHCDHCKTYNRGDLQPLDGPWSKRDKGVGGNWYGQWLTDAVEKTQPDYH